VNLINTFLISGVVALIVVGPATIAIGAIIEGRRQLRKEKK
jgi:hypothetical protein